jgi:perosamine synthetase
MRGADARIRAYPGFPPRLKLGRLRQRAAPSRRWPLPDLGLGLGGDEDPDPKAGEGGVAVSCYRLTRAGIHHGLRAFGIGFGDEVLMPAYHHGVEVQAVRALGARVRFYPIGPDLRVSPDTLAAACSAATRVVYVIHYFGFPQPLAALRALCDRKGLLLLEDCALALFSESEGVPLGAVGDLAVFCLYKTLPVPDGGLLVLPRDRARALRRFGWGARLCSLWPSSDGVAAVGSPVFHPVQLGRAMSPLSRGLLPFMDPGRVRSRRRHHYRRWADALAGRGDPLAPVLPEGVCPLFYPLLVEDKAGLCRALAQEGIELANWWSHPPSGVPPGECPRGDELRRHLVGLPVHQELSEAEFERALRAVARHLGHRRAPPARPAEVDPGPGGHVIP